MKGKSTGDVLKYMNRLLDARIVLSRIRTIVDDDFCLHLDNCVMQTRQYLKTAIEAWDRAMGDLAGENITS